MSNINLDNLSLNFYTTSTFYLVRQLGMVQSCTVQDFDYTVKGILLYITGREGFKKTENRWGGKRRSLVSTHAEQKYGSKDDFKPTKSTKTYEV